MYFMIQLLKCCRRIKFHLYFTGAFSGDHVAGEDA